uniref:Uncharacterized protein n=1 Tax=Coccidioides posadasii RMSCC 3488 TaxID=454284 RepID=A0A0J6IBD9_COCPO|nr:hypothetical protein CPAG_05290 [Coccidioides posadasii RMSCC 3488]
MRIASYSDLQSTFWNKNKSGSKTVEYQTFGLSFTLVWNKAKDRDTTYPPRAGQRGLERSKYPVWPRTIQLEVVLHEASTPAFLSFSIFRIARPESFPIPQGRQPVSIFYGKDIIKPEPIPRTRDSKQALNYPPKPTSTFPMKRERASNRSQQQQP